MDFAVNCELLNEVKNKVTNAKETIENLKGDIYNQIDNLKESWSGASFDTFKEKCHSYEGAIDSLISTLEAFSKMIDNVNSESATLISNLTTELNK